MLGQFGGTPLWELPATAAFGTAPVTAWVAIRYTVSYSVNKISHTKYFLNIIVLAVLMTNVHISNVIKRQLDPMLTKKKRRRKHNFP
jgi:hypothetical protein